MAGMATDSSVDAAAVASTPIKLEESKPTLTPPASEEASKHGDSSSELSEIGDPLPPEEEDIGDIEPDHYWDGGRIPVFKPTMNQFKSFKIFIDKIDKYGMKSGIVKVIPPTEWTNSLPALDEQVKTIKVKNPITQEFNGTQGKYTQANMEKQRTYNLPQWKALTDESNHQPPAKRGERRRNQERVARTNTPRPQKKSPSSTQFEGQKRKPGRPRTRPTPGMPSEPSKSEYPLKVEGESSSIEVPPTPVSPILNPVQNKLTDVSDAKAITKLKGRQPKSVSSRRKNNSHEQADYIDEEAFKDFNYRLENPDEWTKERCQELESAYWKSLNFNNPMYGADMPGSLFDERTTSWNVAKLENLLDVLGQKVPGVNTAYLYLGMWKATFAWHLEDVDLYSINYIHFGAPKQWYSISQEDARKFENAMKTLWPQDAKNCDQFLRHKTYLISPQVLKSQFNIEVNRLVHYEGEFVITFPYGYHSGYNIGYNCAESVNFATESWLDFGKIAKKCNCEADSVWIDVYDIERKLRGEPTPEYEDYIEYEEVDDDEEVADLPTPPGSEKGIVNRRKRKSDGKSITKPAVKRLRLNAPKPPKAPCVLCPNDYPYEDLLPTAEGKQAHRLCALYIPGVYLDDVDGREIVHGVASIEKQRFNLHCLYCRRKNNGACFQCSEKKCARAYHATCAGPAGVAVEIGLQARYDEAGTEYSDVGIDLRCRFHRPKRPKYTDTMACSEALEENALIRKTAAGLQPGELVQFQFFRGDILAGYLLENRDEEGSLLLDLVPYRYEKYPVCQHRQAAEDGSKGEDTDKSMLTETNRRTFEVEYKYVLAFDKAHSNLVAPSANAKPLPAHFRKSQTTQEDPTNEKPKPDQPFSDLPGALHVWAEFKLEPIARNVDQKPVDFDKPRSLAYYLGKTSTEAKPQYTADPAVQVNDPALNFLESVRPTPLASVSTGFIAGNRAGLGTVGTSSVVTIVGQQPRASLIPAFPGAEHSYAPSGLKPQQMPRQPNGPGGLKHERQEKPYKGKYAISSPENLLTGGRIDPQALRNQQAFLQSSKHVHAHPSRPHVLGAHRTPQATATATMMRPGANSQNMAEIRRRQSNPLPPLNMESLSKPQWQQPHRATSQQQQGSSRPSSSQQHAPVANMMGSTSPTAQSTFSRSTTSQQTPPSTANSSVQSRSRSDSVKALKQYPYLHEAAIGRPQVYQSPYGPPGILTAFGQQGLPISKASNLVRPRGKSLTQNFLDSATPSQREGLKNHVRTISTEKAMMKAQEADRRKQEALHRLRANMPPPTQPLSPPFGHSFTQDLFPDRNFSNSPAFPDFNSSSFNSNSDFGNYFPQFQPQSSLHYSSPQSFQQVRPDDHHLRSKPQMMSHGRNSYGALKNLNTGLANLHPHAHGSQDVITGPDGVEQSNPQGSPIRTGRDGVGTATLPMMDPSSF